MKDTQVTLPLIAILTLIFTLIFMSYITLDHNKLERSVFEEHTKSILSMKDDIRSIREIMEKHAPYRSYEK